MSVSIRRGESVSMASGVSAAAKSRSEAGPVVVSWVLSDRMHAIRTRKGSRLRSAMTASAVGFHRGDVRRCRLGDHLLELAPRLGVAAGGDVQASEVDPQHGELRIDREPLLEVLLRSVLVAPEKSRHLHGDVPGEGVGADGARLELQEDLDLLADPRQEEERAEHALLLAPAAGIDRVPEVRIVVPRRELHRTIADLAAARVGGELLLGRRRADVAPEEAHVGEHDHRVDLALARERGLEEVARTVDHREVLVVARDERPRLGGGRLRGRPEGDEQQQSEDDRAGEHRSALYRPGTDPVNLTRPDASLILPSVVSVGVQTWGTDVRRAGDGPAMTRA